MAAYRWEPDASVGRSSAVENWDSILQPYLAMHRTFSTGMLALLAVWHNHRIAPRGLYQSQSPLQRSGFSELTSDWLVALGYPSATPVSVIYCTLALEQEEALFA